MFELTEEQLRDLQSLPAATSASRSENTVWFIKGSDNGPAVLTTASASFALRAAETSNSLFLIEGDPLSSGRWTACASAHSQVELIPTICKPKQVADLLSLRYYDPQKDSAPASSEGFVALQDLEYAVQGSPAEVQRILSELDAVAIAGRWALLCPKARVRITKHMLDSITENDWSMPLAEDRADRLAAEFDASDRMIVLHIAARLTPLKAMAFRAEQLFELDPKWKCDDLSDALCNSLPACDLDVTSLLGEALFFIDRAEDVAVFFPRSSLSTEPVTRFRQIFRAKPMWTAKDLEPYVADLIEPNMKLEQFLMKYARPNQKLSEKEESTYSSRD